MSVLDQVTLQTLRRAYDRLGYEWFEGPYNLNVGAVRANVPGQTGQSRQTDRFDDVLYVAYEDWNGRQWLHRGWGTTDAGLKWLRRKLSSAILGVPRTPILLPGRYGGMYDGQGTHRGYRALRQVGPAQFVGDVDTDDYLDLGYRCLSQGRIELLPTARTFSGVVLANRHRASRTARLPLIGGYSAACTVWQDARDQAEEVKLADLQVRAGHGRRITNVLLTRYALQ